MPKKGQINFLHSTKSTIAYIYHSKLRLNSFPFSGRLNSLNILLTCQYFGKMEKKIVLSETRIAFYQLFIVGVKKLCYESPRGTSRMFFSLYTGVAPAICSYYKLYADGVMEQGRVSVLQWNKHPTQFKNATKNNIIFNFVPCRVRLILLNTNLNTNNNISWVKTVLKKF